MDLQQTAELKAIADLVISIDALKQEKKDVAADYSEKINLLEKQLLALSNEANAQQIRLDL